jgi:hypothetical protein
MRPIRPFTALLPVPADLKRWNFIEQMMAADEMSEERLRAIMATAGVSDSQRMDIIDFEAVLDELTEDINGDYEDDEEGDEDE